MKKFLAILLILVMVVPMCFVAQANETKADVKPYYLVNWSPIEAEFDNLYTFEFIWSRDPAPDITSWKDLYMTGKYFGGNTPETIAESLKAEFNDRPDGTRLIFYPAQKIATNAEQYIFMDKLVPIYRDHLDNLLKIYKDMGGKLDGIVLDAEYNEFATNYMDSYVLDNPFIYKEIVESPYYKERLRPLLEERGFKFWTNITDYSPEIYGINKSAGAGYEDCRTIWNVAVRELFAIYMRETMAPLFEYYPDATLSNYSYFALQTWEMPLEKGSIPTNNYSQQVGTSSNDSYYGQRPGAGYYKNDKTSEPTFNYPVGYNNASYDETPFNAFRWDIQWTDKMKKASPTGGISAWFASYNYKTTAFYNTPYYAEQLLHMGLMDLETFIGYMVPRDCHDDYDGACQVVSDILHELTRMVGYEDRTYISTNLNWNDSFVLTGMNAGGRSVWRLTPETAKGVTLESFKVEGKDPTFYIDGRTITFPSGKIVETGEISKVGSCGYWIEMPSDVMPVVTSDADRYCEYPAFQENYEIYEVGKEYTYNSVEYVTSWQLKKGANGSAVVQADKDNAENNVLAVSGTYLLKNVRVTENITAGDTYAEDQTWEVTVTIPANMAADAEVALLEIYGDKSKPVDGGFKIAGGKLYYSNNGEYVEFADVDVSAGGKFTFKRLVDLHEEGAYLSDYIVYNVSGEEVAKVKDIPMKKTIEIPVAGIGINCTNIAGDPILLDDYKLYASGVAADFYLYDAELGKQVQDITVARDKDTAYRLSWMNATATEKVYSVVAAIYEGGNKVSESVVAEVKMAPNTDGVATGVMKCEEGKSVLVYLRNDSKAEEEPTDNTGTSVTPGESDNRIVIIVVVAAVVVLAAAAIAVLLILKKKKAALPAAEAEAVEATEEAEVAEVTEETEASTETETPDEPTAE